MKGTSPSRISRAWRRPATKCHDGKCECLINWFERGSPWLLSLWVDLAKNVFAVQGLDATGRAVLVRPSVARGKHPSSWCRIVCRASAARTTRPTRRRSLKRSHARRCDSCHSRASSSNRSCWCTGPTRVRGATHGHDQPAWGLPPPRRWWP